MYYSISFANSPGLFNNATLDYMVKNTWEDWHLVPSSRPVINPPTPKTTYVDIPGGDGVIDLSTTLTGYPTYNNREGSWEFIVINDYGKWKDRFSDIVNYLHGKRRAIILEEDPNYYYMGRFSVSNWTSNSDGSGSRVTIDYNLSPYKVNRTIPGITEFTQADGVYDMSDRIGTMPTSPTFTVTGSSMTFYYYNVGQNGNYKSVLVPVGTDIVRNDIKLYKIDPVNDKVRIYVEGEGTLSVKWEEGWL